MAFFSLSHFQQMINHTSHREYGILTNMNDLQHQTILSCILSWAHQIGIRLIMGIWHKVLLFDILIPLNVSITKSFNYAYGNYKMLWANNHSVDSWQKIPLVKRGCHALEYAGDRVRLKRLFMCKGFYRCEYVTWLTFHVAAIAFSSVAVSNNDDVSM